MNLYYEKILKNIRNNLKMKYFLFEAVIFFEKYQNKFFEIFYILNFIFQKIILKFHKTHILEMKTKMKTFNLYVKIVIIFNNFFFNLVFLFKVISIKLNKLKVATKYKFRKIRKLLLN